MASRKYAPVTCFKGDKPYVKLTSVNGDTLDIDLRVDTGFEGTILLDSSTYSKFCIGELPESLWPRFKTLNGYLVMRVSKAMLNVLGR
jgi:predicted aspartyl protease